MISIVSSDFFICSTLMPILIINIFMECIFILFILNLQVQPRVSVNLYYLIH